MRKVDELGRVVIPVELRHKYGLSAGATVEFFDGSDGITIRPFEPLCRICRGKLSNEVPFLLCDSCVAAVVKRYHEKSNET